MKEKKTQAIPKIVLPEQDLLCGQTDWPTNTLQQESSCRTLTLFSCLDRSSSHFLEQLHTISIFLAEEIGLIYKKHSLIHLVLYEHWLVCVLHYYWSRVARLEETHTGVSTSNIGLLNAKSVVTNTSSAL